MTMNIRKYTVSDFLDTYHVTLQVDHDKLTAELAREINAFWSQAEQRLLRENGDPVRTVIRLFASSAINYAMKCGGWDHDDIEPHEAQRLAQKVVDDAGEGWPSAVEMGIGILCAQVMPLGFDDLSLEEED